jgi:macrolide transport system ATP-binding/permease protein
VRTSLESLGRDLRHAWRAIRAMPALAAVVVLSLGVGIGVNTAVFSWVEAAVLAPLPGVRDAADLVLVEPRAEAGGYPGASWREYRDLRERLPAFDRLLAFRMVPFAVGEAGREERTYGLLVSGDYFVTLGIRPALGRLLGPADAARAGGEPVAVVSHDYWRAHLGGTPAALGRAIRVNGRDLTVVGVAPEGFQGTVVALAFDLWVPATMAPALFAGSRELDDRGARGYSVMGRLRDGATRAAAQGELDAAMRQLALAYPESNAGVAGDLLAFWQAPRGGQRFLLPALATLQGVMLLLLLAVCGNSANLLLARASTRRREVGVRLALGAGRWRVARLLLTESLLLALLGAALGAAVAVSGTSALRAVPVLGAFPVRFESAVDGTVLAFATALGVACGLAFGAAPAVQLARLAPRPALASRAATAPRGRARNALMAGQVALALVVLVVAGLFLRSFGETRGTDPGFRREGVLLAAYDLSGREVDDASALGFADRLLRRLRATPGVEAAAIATQVPLDIHGMRLRSFTLEGRASSDGTPDRATSNVVTPGYFATMGIALRAGRDFAALDDAAAPPQVVVNEAFVRRYLDGAEPLGRRLRSRDRDYTIVGVARTSLYDAFGEPPKPALYFSYRDAPYPLGEIHVRTRPGAEAALAAEVRRAARELDASLPLYDVRTLTEHVEKNLLFRRIPARMFAVLGPLLLALAAVGIYAVVAYAVAQRTREIGLRLALGATSAALVWRIVGESMRVVGAGALAGWLVALLSLVVYMHVAPGVTVPLSVFLGVPALLLLVAAGACWLPARRATRVDPAVTLRVE